MNPDLRSACIAYLLGMPSIASAFSATAEMPKFWSDWEGPNNQQSYLGPPQFDPSQPYCVLMVPESDETYETIDQDGNGTSVIRGTLIAAVIADGRTLADQLADRVGVALNDAPLVFGPYAAGSGTVSVTYASQVVNFSLPQIELAGRYLAVTGDTSNGLYLINTGDTSTWSLIEAFTGESIAVAAWGTTDQALLYLRRATRSYPIVTGIGPDGAAVSTPSYVQFRFIIEKVNGPT